MNLLKRLIPTPLCFYKIKSALSKIRTTDNSSSLWERTPAKYRIMLIMLWAYTQFFENLGNVFFYTLSNDRNKYREITKNEKNDIILLYRRLMGNVVTFCYDEGIDTQDPKEFGLEEMKRNIIRLFLCILYGFKPELFISQDKYSANVIKYIKTLDLKEKEEKFICEITESIKILIQSDADFLYSDNHKNADLLNIPIIGALEFGRDLKELVSKLEAMGLRGHASITTNRVLKNLLYGGHGQIHSVLQKDINSMTWDKYIDIAYKKGNDLVRLDHALYGMLDDNFFTQTSCDFVSKQIFCDDVCDLLEDVFDGTLTAAPLFYIAQGKLSQKLKNYYNNGTLENIEECKKHIQESGLSTIMHEGVLMHFHPYGDTKDLASIKDVNGLAEQVKVLISNSEEEYNSNLLDLINKRSTEVSDFIELWKSKNYTACYEHMKKSKVNERFIQGWRIYITKIKDEIIRGTSYNVLDSNYKTSYYYRTMLGWYYRAKYISPIFDRIYLLSNTFNNKLKSSQ